MRSKRFTSLILMIVLLCVCIPVFGDDGDPPVKTTPKIVIPHNPPVIFESVNIDN